MSTILFLYLQSLFYCKLFPYTPAPHCVILSVYEEDFKRIKLFITTKQNQHPMIIISHLLHLPLFLQRYPYSLIVHNPQTLKVASSFSIGSDVWCACRNDVFGMHHVRVWMNEKIEQEMRSLK